ncbi:DNA translocase FtsK 4TM domain-containing protein [Lacibacterium aquatile]|uniref:DNA translocase FtsK n=1 Tax=Lacibacterium aquatile TaxID=1168082 RepID=A0ABW5DMJ1_9PROT
MSDYVNEKSTAPLLPSGADTFIRKRIEETVGLALLLLAVALFLGYLSYFPLDPSPLKATGGPVRNLLGRFGATTSDIGLQTLGLAYLGVIGILMAWGWRWFSHAGLTKLWLRVTLLPPTVMALALACGGLPSDIAVSLPAGPGGVIGELVMQPLALLGPMLGGASRGTIALFGAGLAGVLSIWTLGFGSSEYAALKAELKRRKTGAGETLRGQAAASRRGILGWFRKREKAANPYLAAPPLPAPKPVAEKAVVAPKPVVSKPVQAALPLEEEQSPNAPVIRRVVERPVVTSSEPLPSPFDPAEMTPLPSLELLLPAPEKTERMDDRLLHETAKALEGVLQDFGVRGQIVSFRPGPVVTLYELDPAPGTKSSRVIGLADDIARSMSSIAVRIATVPGRNVIGIELPNPKREMVALREQLAHPDYDQATAKLPLVLGKDIGGAPVIADLAKMPHLLIAGTTGSGKSVGINAMILSLLFKLPPEQCRMIMVDPKMLELSVYDDIPHLLTPVVTDPKKAVVALKWAVREMENRYRAMSKMGVRNIEGYNTRVADLVRDGEARVRRVQVGFEEGGAPIFEDQPLNLDPLPYIVVVVDEMADLMLVAGKEIEACIQRLAQMARAAGIHLIMATQRPSVDVITGTIKANFPTRISFMVTSKIDSRTILGEGGAEQLLGQGDMLYMAGGGRITRVHGPFVSDGEVEQVVTFLKAQGEPAYVESVLEDDEPAGGYGAGDGEESEGGSGDAMFDQAVAIVASERKASTSYIQRRLQIGYNRAARLIERMESEGMVSAPNHVGKREVLLPKG